MSSRRVSRLLVALLLAVGTFSGMALADPPAAVKEPPAAKPADTKSADAKATAADKTQFVRVTKNAKGRPTSLDVAITRYVGRNATGDEVEVDLVGVIHIADKDYYHRLNKRFEKYDAVLYELVAPKGLKPERGSAGIYSPIAGMLELADQIAEVDYTKKNFIHADMSGDEFAESMRKRDESWLKMIGEAIGASIAQASDPNSGASDADLLANLFTSRSPALALKRTVAPQFSDLERSMSWLDGPDGSTILTERNKVALKVLGDQLKTGKRRLAIFYGAGHFPDMEKRLLAEFKLKRGEQTWLAAWDLSGARPGGAKAEKIRPAKATAVSEAQFQRASQALLEEPLNQVAKEHIKTIMTFTAQTPKAAVVIGDEEMKWFGKDDERQGLLMAAFLAGNVQSQLNSGVVRNDRYSGLLSLFKVYRALRAKDKDFKIAAVDEALKLHSEDKLLRHVLELEAKSPTKTPKR